MNLRKFFGRLFNDSCPDCHDRVVWSSGETGTCRSCKARWIAYGDFTTTVWQRAGGPADRDRHDDRKDDDYEW